MPKQVTAVEFSLPVKPQLERVAAYCRVSRDGDAMLHSLSQQVSYYSEMIQNHPGWVFCGVFADEAKTGTKDTRPKFVELLEECRKGNVTRIITKSVSRFARNTVTLLEAVRELKLLGVDVFFEEQNIHTMSADGELMLTILASYAQEESRSASENQKWRIKKNFEEGKPWNGLVLGYRIVDGVYTVVPQEAETVRRIFQMYLDGKGTQGIANALNSEGIVSRLGHGFCHTGITKMLRNYSYTGNLLLQQCFRENHLTKKTVVNEGQLPQYHVIEAHEPIIDMDTFCAVQAEMERRKIKYQHKPPKPSYSFTHMIVCEKCGKSYRRKVVAKGAVWICSTYNTKGKAACPSKQIPEGKLEELTADIDLSAVSKMIAGDSNTVTIVFKDGSSLVRHWADRSRSEAWTPEMKKIAGDKVRERNKAKCRESK